MTDCNFLEDSLASIAQTFNNAADAIGSGGTSVGGYSLGDLISDKLEDFGTFQEKVIGTLSDAITPSPDIDMQIQAKTEMVFQTAADIVDHAEGLLETLVTEIVPDWDFSIDIGAIA